MLPTVKIRPVVWSADCSENMNHVSLLHVIVMMLAFATPLVIINNYY